MNTVVDTTVMDAPDDLDGVDGGGGRRGRPSGPFDHLQLLEVDLEYPAVVAVLAAFVVAGWRPPTRSGGNAILTQHPDDARSIPLFGESDWFTFGEVGAAWVAAVTVELLGECDSAGITLPASVPTEAKTNLGARRPTFQQRPRTRPRWTGPMGGLPSVRLAQLARDAAATVTQLPVVDGTGIDPPPATLSELTRMVDGSQEDASKRAYRADWDEMLGHHLGSLLFM